MRSRSTVVGIALAVLVAVAGRTVGAGIARSAEQWWRSRNAPLVVEPQVEAGNPYERVLTGRIERPHPVASIPLETLISEYEANRFAAEDRFPPQTFASQCLEAMNVEECPFVDVTARIDRLDRGETGAATVALTTAARSATVLASFPEADVPSLRSLMVGDAVTLRCLIVTESRRSSAPAGLMLVRCGVVA